MIKLPNYLTPDYIDFSNERVGACSSECEIVCMHCLACETCLACQTLCEKTLQCHECGACQNSCQCNTQNNQCGNCEYWSQGCTSSCEKAGNCMNTCEYACEGCLVSTACENGCQYHCLDGGCQDTCQKTYQCYEGCGQGTCLDPTICQDVGQIIPTDKVVTISNESPDNGGSFTVTIDGLTNNWNSSNYKSAVITNVDYGGTVNDINTYLRKVTPPSSGTSKGFSTNVINAGLGSYTIVVYAQTDKFYRFGTGEVNISGKKPNHWNWSSSVQNAIDNKGDFSTLYFSEWNDFIDRIKDTILYRAMDYTVTTSQQSSNNMYSIGRDAKYTELLEASKAFSSDKTLYATKFNTARVSIGNMEATGIDTRYQDNEVFGSYFNTLKDKLNLAIG